MAVGWEEEKNVEKLHKVIIKYFCLLTSMYIFENANRKKLYWVIIAL